MLIKEVLKYHNVKDIMKHYRVDKRTAYRWLKQGYALLREYPKAMPTLDFKTIAQRSARYVAARQRDIDLLHECEQAALIALWKDADKIGSDERKAYQAGRAACLNALKQWRLGAHTLVPLQDWLASYEGADDSLEDDGTHTGSAVDDMN